MMMRTSRHFTSLLFDVLLFLPGFNFVGAILNVHKLFSKVIETLIKVCSLNILGLLSVLHVFIDIMGILN